MPRPRCGRGLLPAEPDRASSAGRQGTNTSAPPRSVVTTSQSSPMVGQYAGTLPRPHLRGTWSTRSFPCSPANRPAPALDQLPWSPSSERGAAAGTHTKWQSRSGVDPRASHARPTFDHPFPPGPIRAATTKPRTDHSDTSNPVRQCGRSRRTDGFRIQHGPDSAAAAAVDTGRVSVRTPRITPVAWTPVAWTSDVRPTSWTDVRPHGGQRTRTQRRPPWPASGHPGRPRRRRPPAGRPEPRSGCSVCGAGQSMTAPR
jgi:hypothetical protein